MKKLSRYIPSLIVSVIMVFAVLGLVGIIVADININSSRLKKKAEENSISAVIVSQLEKYYTQNYYTTRIPAEVYMDNISEDYIKGIVDSKIDSGFAALKGESSGEETDIMNPGLEAALESFYSDYADSIGYEKDEAYEKKLDSAKKNAYNIISSSCDIYKFDALKEHGVIGKLTKLYSKMTLLTVCAAVGTVLLMLILFLINIKEKKSVIYWFGTISAVSGVLGIIPCAYLLASGYFEQFTIKQPQIFTSYTTMFTGITEAFMAAMIAVTVAGAAFLIVYSVVSSRDKTVKPTDI